MESPALIHPSPSPPPGLEKIVLCLIPPAARESVAGDLCELYRSPGQYARDALRTIPFIVASQVRRSANLPVLALQGLLLLRWLDGMGAKPVSAAAATALILLASAMLEVYRGSGRPSVRGAIITALMAGAVAELCALIVARLLHADWQTIPYFAFFGPVMVPVLCLVRTAVLLWHDRFLSRVAPALTGEALAEEYRAFCRKSRWQGRIEAFVLVVVALALGATSVSVLYLAAAFYLVLAGEARTLIPGLNAGGLDAGGLGALFRHELSRQHHLRSLVWWLWFAPPFLMMQRGLGAAPPFVILQGLAAALLCGFFIAALDRERRGWVQEEIGSLMPAPRFSR